MVDLYKGYYEQSKSSLKLVILKSGLNLNISSATYKEWTQEGYLISPKSHKVVVWIKIAYMSYLV